MGTFGKLAALAGIVAVAWWLRASGAAGAALAWVEGLGAWAPVVFVALHAVSVVLFVPSIVPAAAGGALFGVALGIPLTVLGVALGSAAALGIGRHLARERVASTIGRDPRFQALDRAVERKGWRIVALARLTPVFPFSIGNYAFGLSRIRARDYLLASGLGTIPSNAVYVYVGSVSGSLAAAGAEGRARTPAEWALLAGGLAATVALALYLRRVAGRALSEDA
jgi:uncharacterized membrane protein YdjX (TVP38/TMEM64 family)